MKVQNPATNAADSFSSARKLVVDVEATEHSHAASTRHFRQLDSFRIIAICLIVLYHMNCILDIHLPEMTALSALLVTYFFVLSGYVLAHQYQSIDNPKQFLRYLASRFARIGPMCIVGFILICILNPIPVFDINKFWPSFFANLFLLQSWFPDRNFYLCFNGPAWTLSVDAFLYLLLPLALVLVRKKWLFFSVSVLASYASSVLAFIFIAKDFGWAMGILPLSRIVDFTLGVIAYEIVRRHNLLKGISFRQSTILESLFFLYIGLISLICYLSFKGSVPEIGSLVIGFLTFTIIDTTSHLLPSIFLACLIVALSCGCGILARLLNFSALIKFSTVSCSLYLIHFPIIIGLKKTFLATPQNPSAIFVVSGLGFLLIIACSIFTFVTIEKPLRICLNHWFDSYFGQVFPKAKAFRHAAINRTKVALPFFKQTPFIAMSALLSAVVILFIINCQLKSPTSLHSLSQLQDKAAQ